MDNEIWVEIDGYNGRYLISNTGRVKSVGNEKSRKEKILKPGIGKGKKYLSVQLRKNKKKQKRYYIHRLVACHFICHKDSSFHVNHIDNNPKNNNIENLEWCTPKENIKHAWKIGASKPHGIYGNYNEIELIEIKILLEFGIDAREIADYYKKSIISIDSIKYGRTFKNFYTEINKLKQLSQ